jgi:hypothetical protein
MKRVIVYVMVVVLTANWAQGTILDQAQEQKNGNTSISGTSYAQTFTVGVGGQLDHIDIYVGHQDYGDQSYPTTVSIVNVNNGVPSGLVIGSIDSHIFDLGWNSVDFLSESMMLTAGAQYGIILYNDDSEANVDPTMHWMINWSGNTYQGGDLWRWSNSNHRWNYCSPSGDSSSPTGSDACFRTYMVPEPTTKLPRGLGAIAVEKLKPCKEYVRSCKPLKDWQGKTMTYTITLPIDFRADRKYPIIFEWPGKGQTNPAERFLAAYYVTGHVHVALKYPLGCEDGRPLGKPTPKYTKFIRRVYRDVVKNFNGDPNYLFIGGVSAGGFMSAGPAIRMLTNANMRDVLKGVVAIHCSWIGSESTARGLNIMICYSDNDINSKKLPSQLPELRRYAKNLTVKLNKGGGHQIDNEFEGPDIRKFFAMNGPDRKDFKKLYELKQRLERNTCLECIDPCYQIATKHNSAYVFAWTLLDTMLTKVRKDIELAEKGQAVPLSVDKMREILNRYQKDKTLPKPECLGTSSGW